MKNWLKYGIIYALIAIMMTLVFYYLAEVSLSFQMISGILIMVTFIILPILRERSDQGGFLTYGDALKTGFLAASIGIVANFIFLIILLQLDPDLAERLTALSQDASRGVMEGFGMSEDQIAEAMEKAEEQGGSQFTPAKQLLSMVTNLIIVFLITAFISLFLRKNKPDDFDPA